MQVGRVDPFFKRLFVVIGHGHWAMVTIYAFPVIIPFLSAFIIAYLLNPIVARLARIMPRWLSIILVYGALIFGLSVLLWWLLPLYRTQIQSLWEYLPNWYR